MSETVPPGGEAGRQAEETAAAWAHRSRDSDRWVAGGIVVVLAAGVVLAWLPDAFSLLSALPVAAAVWLVRRRAA